MDFTEILTIFMLNLLRRFHEIPEIRTIFSCLIYFVNFGIFMTFWTIFMLNLLRVFPEFRQNFMKLWSKSMLNSLLAKTIVLMDALRSEIASFSTTCTLRATRSVPPCAPRTFLTSRFDSCFDRILGLKTGNFGHFCSKWQKDALFSQGYGQNVRKMT